MAQLSLKRLEKVLKQLVNDEIKDQFTQTSAWFLLDVIFHGKFDGFKGHRVPQANSMEPEEAALRSIKDCPPEVQKRRSIRVTVRDPFKDDVELHLVRPYDGSGWQIDGSHDQ